MMFIFLATAASLAASLSFDAVDESEEIVGCEATAEGLHRYTLRIEDASQIARLRAGAAGFDERHRPVVRLDARRWAWTDGGSVWSAPLTGHVTVRDASGRHFASTVEAVPATRTHLGVRTTVDHERYAAHPLGAWARASRFESVPWLELSVEVYGGATVDCADGEAATGLSVQRVRLWY